MRCLGKRACNIRADNRIFGDPCRGHTKYLAIQYKCGCSRTFNRRYGRRLSYMRRQYFSHHRSGGAGYRGVGGY